MQLANTAKMRDEMNKSISFRALNPGRHPATTGANSAACAERLRPARGGCAKPGSREAVGLYSREQHQGSLMSRR